MRKTARLIIPRSIALFILGLFSVGMRTSVVMAQTRGTGMLAAKTNASGASYCSANSTALNFNQAAT
jgi:hypothetical protein